MPIESSEQRMKRIMENPEALKRFHAEKRQEALQDEQRWIEKNAYIQEITELNPDVLITPGPYSGFF